jgi:hypothetical protein
MEAPAKTHPSLPGFSHRLPRIWRFVAIIILIYVGILAGKVAYDLRHCPTSGLDPASAARTLLSADTKTFPSASGPGEQEILAGGTQQFSSVNHPRALGLQFRLCYPQGWKQEPPEGSRALVKFSSGQGKGLESVVLFVVPDPPRSPLVSEKFRKELFNGILAGYRCKYCAVSSRPIKIGGQEGVAVSFDDFKNNAHIKVTNYLLPVGHKMITIQCRVESLIRDAELEARFQRCAPLFDRIAQSLTLN